MQADAWLWVLPLYNSFLGIEFSGVVDKTETYGEADIFFYVSGGSVSFLRLSVVLDACGIYWHERFHCAWFSSGPFTSLLHCHRDVTQEKQTCLPSSSLKYLLKVLSWIGHPISWYLQLPGHSQPIYVHLFVDWMFSFML